LQIRWSGSDNRHKLTDVLNAQQRPLATYEGNEDEQRQKLNDVSKILATLKGRTEGATFEAKPEIAALT
jgi:hypothetical protein